MLLWFATLTVLLTAGNFAWWRARYSKRGVLKTYMTLLARTLVVRFGQAPCYRSTEVTRAFLVSHVTTRFAPYAYALFCDAAEFSRSPGCAQLNYLELRKEIELLHPGAWRV